MSDSDVLQETFRLLQKAEILRLQGPRRLDEARSIGESLVAKHPKYFGALYTLGLIYIDLKKYPQALGCLVRAAMLNTRNWRALTALSAVYLELGAPEMAAHTLEQANLIAPDEPSILITLGEIYRSETEYELAKDAYFRAHKLDRNFRAAATGLGACYVDLGEHEKAVDILQGLVKKGQGSIGLLFEINNLPSSMVTVEVLAELEKLTGKDTDADTAVSAQFIRAREFHRKGRFADAWHELVSANREMHVAAQAELKKLVAAQDANLARIKRHPIKIASSRGKGAEVISLFIQGPSRSGKTTMETLVATLDGVKRGYESPGIEIAVRRTFQGAGLLTSSLFEVLPQTLNTQCCENYLDELSRRAGGARVFTNTHPARIHDAARIAAAIPNVRFIFVKRDRRDNALQIFMRKYRVKNDYAYDLSCILDHIDWYHQMIDTLAEKLPGIVRVVQYEDMIADPRAALKVAADLCGLAVTDDPLPDIGDDRGCAKPYMAFMDDLLIIKQQ